MIKHLLIGGLSLAIATSAAAQTTTGDKSHDGDKASIVVKGKDTDPNRMVCRREKVTGSRLATRKTCMTAAQWENMRAQNKQDLDRIQANRWKSN